MNIYFLVEGQSSEPDVYPVWLSYLVPELKRVDNFDEAEQNNYYLFSSYGIPYIEKDIINAVEDINALQKYHYLVICVDADAATVSQRKAKVFKLLEESKVNLVGTSLKIIVQNRCIETWFLGNRNSKEVQKQTYFNELQNRVKDEPSHLSSFAEFLDFCVKIRSEMTSIHSQGNKNGVFYGF